jgi:hypothetical protein
MLSALLLVCSLAVTPNIHDCNRTNATDVIWMPETSANPSTCFVHAQAYVADTAIGRSITSDERLRVICVPKAEGIRAAK